MSTLSYLDAYCERAGDPSFWAEPVNALTNLCFLWFGWQTVKLLRALPDPSFRRAGDLWALAVLMVAIGIGSGLWHTHATQWSVIADIIPIALFITVYLFSLFMRLMRFRWWQAALVWAGFQALSAASEIYLPRDFLNGSVMYLPTLVVLGGAVLWLHTRQHSGARELGFISLLFVVSLTFRTLDLPLCSTFPLGTHFIWHSLNALVLFRLVKLLVIPR